MRSFFCSRAHSIFSKEYQLYRILKANKIPFDDIKRSDKEGTLFRIITVTYTPPVNCLLPRVMLISKKLLNGRLIEFDYKDREEEGYRRYSILIKMDRTIFDDEELTKDFFSLHDQLVAQKDLED